MNDPLYRALHTPANGASIVLPTIDQLSSIRYVHAQALRASHASAANDEQKNELPPYVYGQAYSEAIEAAIGSGRLLAATFRSQIVATCGWSPAEEGGHVARIRWTHVLPLFSRMGIGRQLLTGAEAAAEAEDFTTFIVRSTPDAAGFIEQAGYAITAHGSRSIGRGRSTPVTYLRKNL